VYLLFIATDNTDKKQFVNYQKHVKMMAEHKYSPNCCNESHTVSTLS